MSNIFITAAKPTIGKIVAVPLLFGLFWLVWKLCTPVLVVPIPIDHCGISSISMLDFWKVSSFMFNLSSWWLLASSAVMVFLISLLVAWYKQSRKVSEPKV